MSAVWVLWLLALWPYHRGNFLGQCFNNLIKRWCFISDFSTIKWCCFSTMKCCCFVFISVFSDWARQCRSWGRVSYTERLWLDKWCRTDVTETVSWHVNQHGQITWLWCHTMMSYCDVIRQLLNIVVEIFHCYYGNTAAIKPLKFVTEIFIISRNRNKKHIKIQLLKKYD